MAPQITILIIAIMGAFVDGITGFFVWGICGYIGVLAFGLLLNLLSGGVLPKKVRDETAKDFIAEYPDLIEKAYPGASPNEAKQMVATFLENIIKIL